MDLNHARLPIPPYLHIKMIVSQSTRDIIPNNFINVNGCFKNNSNRARFPLPGLYLIFHLVFAGLGGRVAVGFVSAAVGAADADDRNSFAGGGA